MHHSESDTLKQTSTEPYVIGIIVEPDRLTCKHYLINRVLNYITSEATINHREVRILMGLRNPYEQTLARRLITLKHRYSNIYVELLISDNQLISLVAGLKESLNVIIQILYPMLMDTMFCTHTILLIFFAH